MPKGILYVETRPASAEREAEYHKWYDQTHLPDVVAIPGFVAARRYAPLAGDDGPFVAVYDVEADDLSSVTGALQEAMAAGRVRMSDALQLDPPPTMRLLELTTTYEGDGRASS